MNEAERYSWRRMSVYVVYSLLALISQRCIHGRLTPPGRPGGLAHSFVNVFNSSRLEFDSLFGVIKSLANLRLENNQNRGFTLLQSEPTRSSSTSVVWCLQFTPKLRLRRTYA
ncbi:unnamed protein product, partial [Ectocarpus sp. 8 AP-2014]